MSSSVRTPFRLGKADSERYSRLRQRMLDDSPWAFEAGPDDDGTLEELTKSLMEEHNAVFAIARDQVVSEELAAGNGKELVAGTGITRATGEKFAHRARVWGVYVEPAHRGKGLGKAVMSAAIELARTWDGVEFVDLGVSENSPEARRLYERLGFKQWGREPEATNYDGRRFDEIYMTLRLSIQ